MPVRRGHVASQNTFIDTIIRKFEGQNRNFLIANAKTDHCGIIYCNDGFCDLTGYSRAEIMQKSCKVDFLYGDKTNPQAIKQLVDSILCRTETSLELLLKKKDDSGFLCQVVVLPVKNDQDEIVLFILNFEDITNTQTGRSGSQKFGSQLKFFKPLATQLKKAQNESSTNVATINETAPATQSSPRVSLGSTGSGGGDSAGGLTFKADSHLKPAEEKEEVFPSITSRVIPDDDSQSVYPNIQSSNRGDRASSPQDSKASPETGTGDSTRQSSPSKKARFNASKSPFASSLAHDLPKVEFKSASVESTTSENEASKAHLPLHKQFSHRDETKTTSESNRLSGGSANNTVQTPHQVRVASSHQQQQPTQSTILQSHHAFTQQPQNKALMPNGKLQTSILKKPPLLPAAGAGTNQCAVSPYMTSSKSADSISNLTATLDRWHTIGGSGVAARRSSHLPSSFSNYSFNYNSVNTSNNNTSQPTSTASPTTPVAGTAGSSHLFNNNFKRNSSSVIPFHRNQPIGNNHNLPDIFCHNNRYSSVMPSDSYYSFFTPSSNSVSTIPAAYEYHPLCSNPASPCEDKIHFGKMGARPNEIEVVGHTSTGGRPGII